MSLLRTKECYKKKMLKNVLKKLFGIKKYNIIGRNIIGNKV